MKDFIAYYQECYSSVVAPSGRIIDHTADEIKAAASIIPNFEGDSVDREKIYHMILIAKGEESFKI